MLKIIEHRKRDRFVVDQFILYAERVSVFDNDGHFGVSHPYRFIWPPSLTKLRNKKENINLERTRLSQRCLRAISKVRWPWFGWVVVDMKED